MSRGLCACQSVQNLQEKLGPGGACHHPASPLDVTVVLCEQRWGTPPGPRGTLLEAAAPGGKAQ